MEINLSKTNRSLCANTFDKSLNKLPIRLIGQKSLILTALVFLGIKHKKVALRDFSNIHSLWKAAKKAKISLSSTHQHFWKKAMVKPPGLGALSPSASRIASMISSFSNSLSKGSQLVSSRFANSRPSKVGLQDSYS